MRKAQLSTCRLCGQQASLCLSHAIPNAFFRSILRNNNGSAIAIPKGKGKIHLSGDTGKAELLCQRCETLLNEKFDKPLVDCLRELDRQILKTGFNARISFSHNRLARCVASVFWRGCISTAKMYRHVKLTAADEGKLFQIMIGNDEDALRKSSVSLLRLHDPTPEGFSQEVVSNLVFGISAYQTRADDKATFSHYALDMCIQGFLVHLFIPKVPHKQARQPRYLKCGGRVVHAPPTNMLNYPPLMDMMLTGFAKIEAGERTPAVKR